LGRFKKHAYIFACKLRIVMDEYLKAKEACEFLGIKLPTLYQKTRNREIPFFKPNGKIMYFSKHDLEAYITRHHYPIIE